jgi:hypothetical protein
MIQDKTQFAVNGHSIDKGCNAVLDHLWPSRRARPETVICGVAFLEKDRPFPANRVLQLTVSGHADRCHLIVTPH